jgi:hypothetical protein
MFIFLTRVGRLFVGAVAVIAVTSIFGFNSLTSVPVASKHLAGSGSACSVTPSTVALDQPFTIYATGLPSSNVNLIRQYPNGSTETMPISVSNGSFTLTQSSADSVFPSEQTGTYTYLFVGKVRWPQGTYNQIYATCSVSVT